MNYLFWILVGLILGWVIEWVIDWLFWRKPKGASPEELAALKADNQRLQSQLAVCGQKQAELEAENSRLKASANAGQAEPVPATRQAAVGDVEATMTSFRPVQPDPLADIDGIGPVYAKRLNEAGIYSFTQLAELSAERVREIIKPEEWQKIEPEKWIAEAREQAAQKHDRAASGG